MGNGLEFEKDRASLGKSENHYAGLNKSTHEFILKLTLAKFFGSLKLTFVDGKIVDIDHRRHIKP